LRTWLVALWALSITAPARAQRMIPSVELSGVGVWYADSVRSAGASVTPALRVDWTNATLNANATYSRLGQGASSLQGTVAPSVFSPSFGAFSVEGAGSFGGSSHHDGTRTGQAIGLARIHLMKTEVGGWLGAGLGRTWDGDVWHGVRQAEIGAWTSRDGIDALATVTPVAVADTLRYTDFQAALRLPTRRFELGVTGGARAGSVGAAVGGSSRVWGNLTGTAWVSPRMAIVASAGNYPVDLTQGFPGGRFVTLALRFASRGVIEPAIEPTAPSVPAFEVRPAAQQGRRTLRFNAPAARTVEITGDFTKWQSVRLTREAGGWWSIALPIGVGTHQINVRFDGGAWGAPQGLLTSRDEFGGVVGILTIR
jgi:hypothetical protein